MRQQVKAMLRRRQIEVVLPRRQMIGTLGQIRLRRTRLPAAVEMTRDAASSQAVLVDLAFVVNRARFGFGAGSWHPYVAALRERLARPDHPYEMSVLARFYERFQPLTVHDVLLGDQSPHGEVASWPAVDALLDVWNVTDRRLRRVRSRVAGRQELPPSQYRGPTPLAHGRHHLERVLEVHQSIRDEGYRPGDFHDGVATGYFLVDGEDYRFVLGGGNHRMAALTVIGVSQVLVRTRLTHPPVVARGDLRRWTDSGGGLYSPEEASALFDSYFADDGAARAHALGLA